MQMQKIPNSKSVWLNRYRALAILVLCGAIPALWGLPFIYSGASDFKAVYFGTRALLQGNDPYQVGTGLQVYLHEGGEKFPPDEKLYELLSRQPYLPTALLFTAPVARLPWPVARTLWMLVSQAILVFACFLMWTIAARSAPRVSLALLAVLLANCEIAFSSGNPAVLSIGLLGIAVWCFFEDRFPYIGAICLACSLMLKPHDSGMIWLGMVLLGGVYRKRALQSFAITLVFAAVAALWIGSVAPHWPSELLANLAVYNAPHGFNSPGPEAYTSAGPAMVIDFQAALSLFKNTPGFYRPASLLVCGVLVLIWIFFTIRARGKDPNLDPWLVFAAAVPLTMLVTYHRPYDAKLYILAIPLCASLWLRKNVLGMTGLVLNALAIVATSDIPLALVLLLDRIFAIPHETLTYKVLALLLFRPAPFALLLSCAFCLWLLARGPWSSPRTLQS